jgi:hypothetical protein
MIGTIGIPHPASASTAIIQNTSRIAFPRLTRSRYCTAPTRASRRSACEGSVATAGNTGS